MAKNKILVTGGCGYIGSQTIIQILRNTSYEVISADNFSNSSAKTIERIKSITGKEIQNYNLDLADFEATKLIFEENTDILGVINFAALKSVPESVEQPVRYYRNNINSLLNVLDLCEKHKVKKHIFSSSCSVYGDVERLPVTEDTPLNKTESPYAHTKLIGEQIIENFAKTSNVKNIALRYFNPVGADETGLIGEDPVSNAKPNNLVPVITRAAAGQIKQLTVYGGDYPTRDGSCVRDYIHVMDIADAHLQAFEFLLKSEKNFEIFNLGTGNGVSVFEAINAFEKVTGEKVNYTVGPRRAGDVMSIYSDCTKSRKELGWEAKRNIEEMMSSAWKWQLKSLEK